MNVPNSVAQQDVALARRLHDAHDTYREPALTHRRFKHRDLVPLLGALNGQAPLSVSAVGASLEGRTIYRVHAGTGSKTVLLWSQMHGDEATATMALFDIFNFLKAQNDGFDELRQRILTNVTLYAVPMLNPDGAERFQRRTATDIDMNRDALRLQTPEGQLLKQLQQTLKPLVGFNLHDQNPRYGVGTTGQQAVVSFLATAYDSARSINDVRRRSMQLIVGMNRALQPFVPGGVARYDDEFEPRAFGDNIQKWGTSLVLIESGGYRGDPEKMTIRRLNFVAILTALAAIADDSYGRENIADYAAIPENGRPLFDLLIRNATVLREGRPVTLDIGINRYEVNADSAAAAGGRWFTYRSVIEDLGDLSTFHGLTELDATGLTVAPVRQYADTLNTPADLRRLDVAGLARDGVVAYWLGPGRRGYVPIQPVHLLREGKLPARPLQLGQVPTFLLKAGNRLRAVFVNGFRTDEFGAAGANGILD